MKRIFLALLMFALAVTSTTVFVSAGTDMEVSEYSQSSANIPDYDIWMAQTLINGINNSGNGLYPAFQGYSEPVYKQLGGYLLDDVPLVSISTMWSVFFNSEYRNQFANEQRYIYEVILMDYLKYDAGSNNIKLELDNKETEFGLKLYSLLTDDLADNTYDYIQNMSVDEAVAFYSKNVKDIENMGIALSEVKDGADNVKDLINMLSEYLALQQVKEERVLLLKAARDANYYSSTNYDFINAVNDLVNVLEGTTVQYVQGKSLDYLWEKACDYGWEKLGAVNPVLKMIDLGVTGLDMCFDTTNKASNNLKLVLFYTADCYLQQGMMRAKSQFTSNNSSVNGRTFQACFQAYIQFQNFGNEYAKTWLNGYLHSGFISDAFNWLFNQNNISTANELISLCDSQINNRKSTLDGMDKCANVYQNMYGKTVTPELIPKSTKSSITINKGKTKKFGITNLQPKAKVTYSTSSKKIATVSSSGTIKGIKDGTAVITAKVMQNSKTYILKISANIYDEKVSWYKKVLRSRTGTYKVRYQYSSKVGTKTVKRSDFTYYKVLDLNKDGVNELLLATNRFDLGWDNRVLLLTYHNHKVKPLICFEGAGYRGKQMLHKKSLILITSGSDFSYQLCVTVSGGKLKVIQQTERYRMKMKTPYYDEFRVNKKKVSKATYDKALKKYPLSALPDIKYQFIS